METLSLKETAENLAASHRQADPKTSLVYFFPDEQAGQQIKLLEVSEAAPDTGDILPFSFNPDPKNGVHFASTVILLNPAELELVQAGELVLPAGWDLQQAEVL